MKYAACIEYDGSNYCGWQRLSHAESVQGHIEFVLSKVANEPIEVVCAGRTDSGVHALGQVIHFESNAERTLRSWQLGVNTNLPDDISIREIQTVHNDFHARFSALSRQYRYIIANQYARPAILNNKVTWHFKPLNAEKMHDAAQALIGEKDFSSFRAAGCQAKHANRNIHSISVSREGNLVYVDIRANAFLHHMVRNIVGSLLSIGEGEKSVKWMEELLAIKDRKQAGVTAKASGLYFVSAEYPDDFNLNFSNQLPKFLV